MLLINYLYYMFAFTRDFLYFLQGGLLVMNTFSFSLSGKLFISSSILNDYLDE